MSEPIANHYKCINLTQDDACITKLEDCLNGIKKGFHAFYTHEGLITGIDNTIGGSPELLETIFKSTHSCKTMSIKDDMHSELFRDPSKSPLVLIRTVSTSQSEKITTFTQTLREILSGDISSNSSNFAESPGFSLNQASSWDLFLEREKYSGLIPGAHDYHEYLLWDDGGCVDKERLDDLDVWKGAGWINSRLQKHQENSPDKWQLNKLGEWFKKSNDQLSHDLENLAVFCDKKNTEPYNLESHNNFIRSLCEFLPYHKSLRTNKPIPSNSLGERGGRCAGAICLMTVCICVDVIC